MKVLIAAFLFSSVAMAVAPETKKNPPVKKVEQKVTNEKLKMLDKKEEDCDDKAKKPVVIVPETISLGGGNAGCTLPE